jgi:hypothetical protein
MQLATSHNIDVSSCVYKAHSGAMPVPEITNDITMKLFSGDAPAWEELGSSFQGISFVAAVF